MQNVFKLNLQLFAEGAGTGGAGEGGGTAPTGETAPVAGEQRLLDLGVPRSKIRASAIKAPAAMEQKQDPKTKATEKRTAQEAPTGETAPAAGEQKKPTWKEIMADPDYNREMQETVKGRLKESEQTQKDMAALTPALKLLAQKYKVADPTDISELSKAIQSDNAYYEDKAAEMGVSVDVARHIEELETKTAQQEAQQKQTLEQQMARAHITKMVEQGEEMKKIIPSFDLRKELENETFARLVSPQVNMKVETAYYAVHHREMQEASMRAAAQQAAQKVALSIQAKSARPEESGSNSQAAVQTSFDWKNASREQREAFRQKIHAAAARNQKIYPGGERQ